MTRARAAAVAVPLAVGLASGTPSPAEPAAGSDGFAWDRAPTSQHEATWLPRSDGAGRCLAEPWPELAEVSAARAAGFSAPTLAVRAAAP